MDVKEILVDKKVIFKSRGKDYVVRCFSPEHEDVNPSMKIDKISGLFHCVSCGFSGDLFKYYKINKEKFIDIKVKQLLEKIQKLQVLSLNLPLDAVHFKEDFRGISNKTLKEFGAFTSDSMSKMEGRLVFPIWNIHGNIIGFQGRYLYSDLEPKYEFYPYNISPPLYPAIVKPIKNSIILVEGILDMMNLHDKGLKNTVCTWGTAFGTVKKISKKQRNIDRLLQYKYQGVDTLYIMYDGDIPGQRAAEGLYNYTKDIFMVDIIKLPEDKDPGKLTETEINKIKEEYYV
jgi:DNA primase